MFIKDHEKIYVVRKKLEHRQDVFACKLGIPLLLYRFYEKGEIELNETKYWKKKKLIMNQYINNYFKDIDAIDYLNVWILRNAITQINCMDRLGISWTTLSFLKRGAKIERETAERIFEKTNGFVNFC